VTALRSWSRSCLRAASARDGALLFLRLGGACLLWTYHVQRKLVSLDEEWLSFPDPLGIGHPSSLVLALISEGLCSFLVAVGLATRLASLPILISMSMVVVLLAGGFPDADLQSALLYSLIFGAIAVMGPGRLSLDHAFRARYEQLFRYLRSQPGRGAT
jgi:putative oxidoreductase